MLKKPRNWIVTFCNKIIIRILLPTLKIKIYHISTSTQDLCLPHLAGPHSAKWRTLRSRGHMKSCDKKKNDISPLPRRLWLPNGKVELYNKGTHPSSILTLWARDQVITWLIKKVVFLLLGGLWLTNLTEWWVLFRVLVVI